MTTVPTIPRDSDDNTILHYAAMIGDMKACNVFINYAREKNSDSEIPFHDAITNGHLDTVKLFLNHDSSLKIWKHEETGWTPLHYAVRHCHLSICKLLIDTKDEKNKEGQTALDLAKERKRGPYWSINERKKLDEIIELLSGDENGKDELQVEIAKLQSQLDKVKSLLEKKK